MTIAEKLIEMLKDFGAEEVDSPSCKYRKFTNPNPQPSARFYWVGKLGALRFGRTVSESTPKEHTKNTLLRKWAEKHPEASDTDSASSCPTTSR